VLAGFHEVVYTEGTKTAYEKAKAEGKHTWRVSSTMFTTFRYDVDCTPMPELAHLYDKEHAESYGHMTACDILMTELSAINLAADSTTDDDESKSPVEEKNHKIDSSWADDAEFQK